MRERGIGSLKIKLTGHERLPVGHRLDHTFLWTQGILKGVKFLSSRNTQLEQEEADSVDTNNKVC